jgi:hypothetical protein
VDILSASQGALAAVFWATPWKSPLVRDTITKSEQLRNHGCTLKLVQAPDDEETEGMNAVRTIATRAARRQPRQLRSASLSYAQQRVRETKPTVAKINKYLGDLRKSAKARYLQLKSGHAVIGKS